MKAVVVTVASDRHVVLLEPREYASREEAEKVCTWVNWMLDKFREVVGEVNAAEGGKE